jgi:drug/metabolite transporter (DMT)-like permease|tara:strand:+ start:1775 stop:2668 length:894 start_codon:yes stop_codon:yes gene_type:complete
MALKKSLTGIIIASSAAICFAANTTASPLAANGGSSVLTYLVLRTTIATLVVFILLLITKSNIKLCPKRRWMALGVGMIMAIHSFALLSAIQHIPIALAVLIFYTFPILTTLYLWLIGRDRANWLAGIALFFGLAGLALALNITDSELDIIGIGLAVISAIGITVVIIINSQLVGKGDSRPVTLHMLISASIVFIILTATLGEFHLPNTIIGWWAFSSGPFFYSFAIISLFIAIAILGPIKASMTMNLEPISSMLLGFLILNQSLNNQQVFGSAVVIISILLIQQSNKQKKMQTKEN